MKLTFELPLMYRMREIVTIGVVFEVRYKFVKISRICLERATSGELDISDDLVHSDAAGDVATFVRLFMDLVFPVFITALDVIKTLARK